MNYGPGPSFTAADYENRRNVGADRREVGKVAVQGENPIAAPSRSTGCRSPWWVCVLRSSSGPVINNFKDYQMCAGSTAGTIFIPDVCCGSVPYRYDEPR
ncbi:MAG: hypothetical protein ACLUYZ_06565 [Lachnospiraceae bacterium]